tara:strand:+ start:335 stop:658 length:324 start_codon:yes stop_codon:yes gene_type:complete
MVSIGDLHDMSMEELRELNENVVHVIKHKRKLAAKMMKQQLNEGDEVYWISHKTNKRVDGRILKVNRTKCKVIANDSGARWTVPMTMLKPNYSKRLSNFNPNTGGFE